MNGGFGFTGQSPSAACRSVWQTPQASILTSTSPAPGRGTDFLDDQWLAELTHDGGLHGRMHVRISVVRLPTE
jgi:hypothetical protein